VLERFTATSRPPILRGNWDSLSADLLGPRVPSLAGAVAQAVRRSGIVTLSANLYGTDFPLWNPRATNVYLVHEQFLVKESVMEVVQTTNESETRFSSAVVAAVLAVLDADLDIAAFISDVFFNGGPKVLSSLSLTLYTCQGSKQCVGLGADGLSCPTIDVRGRLSPCSDAEHRHLLLSEVACGARLLVVSSAASTKCFIVVPLDPHTTHPDLPIAKIPIALKERIALTALRYPSLEPSDLVALTIDGVNGGDHILLHHLCPALLNRTRICEIFAKIRKQSTGLAPAIAAVAALEVEFKHKFIHRIFVGPLPSEPQVLLLTSLSDLHAWRDRSTGEMCLDLTFGVVNKAKDGTEFFLLQGCVSIDGGSSIIVQALVNGKKTANYQLFYKALFEVIDDFDPAMLQNIPRFMFDFERADIKALRTQLCLRFGMDEGEAIFHRQLGLCSVHWSRIIKGHGTHGRKRLFKEIGHHVAAAMTHEHARTAFALLCRNGPITMLELLSIGMSEPALRPLFGDAVELNVNWSAKKGWVSNLLKEENRFILDALTRGVGLTDTNLVEQRQSDGPLRSIKAARVGSALKSFKNVLVSLFHRSLVRCREREYVETGGRLTHRSAGNSAARSNQAMNQAEEDSRHHGNGKTVLLTDRLPKKRGRELKSCTCAKLNCHKDQRCSCHLRNSTQGAVANVCNTNCKCTCSPETRVMATPDPETLAAKRALPDLVGAGEVESVAAVVAAPPLLIVGTMHHTAPLTASTTTMDVMLQPPLARAINNTDALAEIKGSAGNTRLLHDEPEVDTPSERNSTFKAAPVEMENAAEDLYELEFFVDDVSTGNPLVKKRGELSVPEFPELLSSKSRRLEPELTTPEEGIFHWFSALEGLEERQQLAEQQRLDRLTRLRKFAGRFGRVEDKDIEMAGDCLFDGAARQLKVISLDHSTLTKASVRSTCVRWVMDTYGSSDANGLCATGEYTSWDDWRNQMSQPRHFADEMIMEALRALYSVRTLVMCGGIDPPLAYSTEVGAAHLPVLCFGLDLEIHFSSLRLATDCVVCCKVYGPKRRLIMCSECDEFMHHNCATSISEQQKAGLVSFRCRRLGCPSSSSTLV
jgi:hypothetical protein